MVKNRKKKILLIIISIASLIGCLVFYYFINEDSSYDDELYYKQLKEEDIIENDDGYLICKNQIIVEGNDLSKKDMESLIEIYDGEIVGHIAITNTYQIEFDEKCDLNNIINKMKDHKDIKHISYNYVLSVDDQAIEYPNDRKWKNQWSDIPDGGNWGLEAMDVPETWDYISDKNLSDINIGVFEVAGFDENHKDLKNNINSKLGNFEETDLEHGTEVCGIISAEYDNKYGICGVTMNKGKIDYFGFHQVNKRINNIKEHEDLMAYKIGLAFLCSKAKDNNQTAIINMSLGLDKLNASASFNNEEARNLLEKYNNELEEYLENLLNQGYDFLIVQAAGNNNELQYLKIEYDGKNEETKYGYVPYNKNKKSETYKKYYQFYPENQEEINKKLTQGNCDAQYDIFSGIKSEEIKDRILVVGAVENEGNNKIKLSDWYSVCGERVDILAPGTAIQTLDPDDSLTKSDKYGTSFSAPYVSGIAGLILSYNKSLSGKDLKKIIVGSGVGEYESTLIRYEDQKEIKCQYKMANAFEAIKLAEKYVMNQEAYKVYADKFKEYKNKYGNISEKYEGDHTSSLYLEGLCYANLIDFNNDNLDELLLVYFDKKNQKYHYDVYGYKNDDIKLLESSINSYKTLQDSNTDDFTNELYSNQEGTIYLKIYEYDNKYYICTGNEQYDPDQKYHYYFHGFDNNNQFGICESIKIDYENQVMEINDKQESLDKIQSQINKYNLYKDFYFSTYIYNYELFPIRSEGSMLLMLNDINETIKKLDIDEKMEDKTEYRFFYGEWKDLSFEEAEDIPQWWNGTTVFNPDCTIYREIWRQKEEGTYTVSGDGNVITAILTKQTTSAPLTDENSSYWNETDSFYLKITYRKQDDNTMSVEYSSVENTVQNSTIIHKE